MKKRYKRKAYLLDAGILLCGYKDKRGFHPEKNLPCGFNAQINKKSIGKKLFFSFKEAVSKMEEIELAGGKIIICIDSGLYATRVSYRIGDLKGCFQSNVNPVNDTNIDIVIRECLNYMQIKKTYFTEIIHVYAKKSYQEQYHECMKLLNRYN